MIGVIVFLFVHDYIFKKKKSYKKSSFFSVRNRMNSVSRSGSSSTIRCTNSF